MSHRRTFRTVCRGVLAVAASSALALATAPSASAKPSTVVTGRVTGDGLPLQHVVVSV